MEVSRAFEISSINEIKILSNVRLISRHDLNPIYSKENLQVQFQLTGELTGTINCFLCLDGHELSASDKNYLFPLFVESMNILIGKQVSADKELKNYQIKLSPPKLSMIAKELNTAHKASMQSYFLELEGYSLAVLSEYIIGVLS
jgi:hypothetical protein